MSPYVIIGGIVMWAPLGDIHVHQAQSQTAGSLFMSITFTDAVEGDLTLLLGAQGFDTDLGRVYACVQDFGSIRTYMGQGAAEVTVALGADTVVVPTTSSTRYTIVGLLRATSIRSQPVTVYQWNADASSSEAIWQGFLVAMSDYSFDTAVPLVRLVMRSEAKAEIVNLAPIINSTDYPNAPSGSTGQMLSVAYGDYRSVLSSGVDASPLPPFMLGYPLPAIPAVPTDEKITSGTSRFTRYVFVRNDGTTGVTDFDVESLGSAITLGAGGQGAGDVVVYMPEASAYAVLSSNATYFPSLDLSATEAAADISNAPRVFVVMRPLEIGASHTASVTDAYKPIDNDSTNSISITGAGTNLGYVVPSLNLSGARVEKLFIAVDFAKNGTVDVGLYNPQESGGANYWGGAARKVTPVVLTTSRVQFTTQAANGGGHTTFLEYTQADAATSNGGTTSAQFQAGRFVGMDSGKNEVPIDLRIAFSAGTSCTVYGVAIIAQIIYPKKSLGHLGLALGQIPGGFVQDGQQYDIHGKPIPPHFYKQDQMTTVLSDPSTGPGLNLISAAQYQKDDTSGTYTGTASALLQKAPDIVRHILQKRGGFTVNATAGTLGNFTDMRTEDTAGDKTLAPSFQGERIDALSAANVIGSRWPIRIVRDRDVYHAFGDDMNPDASRVYRSTSEPIRISARRHLVGNYVRVQEDDPTGIVNRVTINYGIGFGRGDSLGSYRYNNPLSQDAFGISQERTFSEPWIIPSDLSAGAPNHAKFLAMWQGRRAARPRIRMIVRLTQAFYDLRRGHVLECDTDWEGVGIQCPAFRCGRFDYQYPASTGTTNQAFDTTPDLIPASGTDSFIAMASQQFPSITLKIASAATHTTVVGAWKYWNGTAKVALTNVTCSDAGSADTVFKRTGTITVSFDRPLITSWKKAELTFNGVLKGPGYPIYYDYTSATVAATGNGICTYPAKWNGRLFEVLDTSRDDSTGIPIIEAMLQEVM